MYNYWIIDNLNVSLFWGKWKKLYLDNTELNVSNLLVKSKWSLNELVKNKDGDIWMEEKASVDIFGSRRRESFIYAIFHLYIEATCFMLH